MINPELLRPYNYPEPEYEYPEASDEQVREDFKRRIESVVGNIKFPVRIGLRSFDPFQVTLLDIYGDNKSDLIYLNADKIWPALKAVQFKLKQGQEILLELLKSKYRFDEDNAYQEGERTQINNDVEEERLCFPSQTHPSLIFVRVTRYLIRTQDPIEVHWLAQDTKPGIVIKDLFRKNKIGKASSAVQP